MNWSLDVNVLLQLFTMAAIAGMGWQKINALERDISRLEAEVIAHRDLKADLTVVKERLQDISEKIKTITHCDVREAL